MNKIARTASFMFYLIELTVYSQLLSTSVCTNFPYGGVTLKQMWLSGKIPLLQKLKGQIRLSLHLRHILPPIPW